MTEQYVLAEPPTDEAFYRAQTFVLNKLSAWLCDEREKLEPSSERWRTLADVTEAIHRFTAMELYPSADAVDPHAGSTGKLSTRDKGI